MRKSMDFISANRGSLLLAACTVVLVFASIAFASTKCQASSATNLQSEPISLQLSDQSIAIDATSAVAEQGAESMQTSISKSLDNSSFASTLALASNASIADSSAISLASGSEGQFEQTPLIERLPKYSG